MFIETELVQFPGELSHFDDAFSCGKSEINCTTWDAFEMEGPCLVDCCSIPDRKPTACEEENFWEESAQPLPLPPVHTWRVEFRSLSRTNKNQTKNIPKNYGKATLLYIKNNRECTNQVLSELKVVEEDFFEYINNSKLNINTIRDIRCMWTHGVFGKAIRILSYQFLRKHALSYIFNSRVKNHSTHVKYRNKLMDGLRNPECFNNIKDF